MNFKKWVKRIQTAGYNGTCRVLAVVVELNYVDLANYMADYAESAMESVSSESGISAV